MLAILTLLVVVYVIGVLVADGHNLRRKNTTRKQDWRDAKRWPLAFFRWLLGIVLWALGTVGRLAALVLFGPALLVGWVWMRFDPESPPRVERRRRWQHEHGRQCADASVTYGARAADAKAKGYPCDAAAHAAAAELMRRLAADFTDDRRLPDENPPQLAALSETAATRTVDDSPRG
jgi:hypothetical protein